MRRPAAGRAAIIHPPPGFEARAFPDGPPAMSRLAGKFDWIQIFVRSKADLDKIAPKAVRALKPQGLLWVSFPKGSSGMQTDLTRDRGWERLNKLDRKWITLISVDETWSAFALRLYQPGEAHKSFR
jgi:hypothetical protein